MENLFDFDNVEDLPDEIAKDLGASLTTYDMAVDVVLLAPMRLNAAQVRVVIFRKYGKDIGLQSVRNALNKAVKNEDRIFCIEKNYLPLAAEDHVESEEKFEPYEEQSEEGKESNLPLHMQEPGDASTDSGATAPTVPSGNTLAPGAAPLPGDEEATPTATWPPATA